MEPQPVKNDLRILAAIVARLSDRPFTIDQAGAALAEHEERGEMARLHVEAAVGWLEEWGWVERLDPTSFQLTERGKEAWQQHKGDIAQSPGGSRPYGFGMRRTR